MKDIDYIINYIHDRITEFSIEFSKHYKISGQKCMSIYFKRTQVILYNLDTKAFYFMNKDGLESLEKHGWPYYGYVSEYPCYICESPEEEFQMSTVLDIKYTAIPYRLYPQASKILERIMEMVDLVKHL